MIALRSLWSRRARFLVALMSLVVLAGCAGRKVANEFPTRSPPSFTDSGEVEVPSRWWVTFNDTGLNARVDQALNGSFTLAAALQRLRAARAVTRREASDLFPDVNGIGDIGGLFGPGPSQQSYVLGLDAAYQVDVWGEIGSRVEAERLRASATREDYYAVALTLSAEIARTWFSLIEANAQIELLEEQIETNKTGLALQEVRFGLGLIRSADVLRQRQLVESTLEQEAVVQSRIALLEHRLAVLMGEMPQLAAYDPGVQLPEIPPLPNTGMPSELLQRRPDVRRDYLAFMAADRDLASAISRQYPRISLTGSLLNVAERPETIFRDWFVSIGGQLIAPLVDGGQRRAEVDRTSAVVRQRFNEYGDTMLTAFRDVEDALAREKYQLERLQHLNAQLEWARQASDQLKEQYLLDEDTDYLSVLTAITAQQRLQRETLAARLELVLIRVALYLALAGDFDTRPLSLQDLDPTVEFAPDTIDFDTIDFETIDLETIQPEAIQPETVGREAVEADIVATDSIESPESFVLEPDALESDTVELIEPGPVEPAPREAGPIEAGPIEAGPIEAGPIEAGPITSEADAAETVIDE